MKLRRLCFFLLAGLALPLPAVAQEDPVVASEEDGLAPAPGSGLRSPEVKAVQAQPTAAGSRTNPLEGDAAGGTTAANPVPRPGQSSARRHQQILMWGSAAVFSLLALLLLLRRRRAHRPRLFPFTVPRERFSAPHSGGNNAMISFGSEKPRDPG